MHAIKKENKVLGCRNWDHAGGILMKVKCDPNYITFTNTIIFHM